MRISDWSSDVCSSDLTDRAAARVRPPRAQPLPRQRQRRDRGRAPYPVARDLDLPALWHDDRPHRHAARQWVGGAAAHHPGADDVSDPPRLLLAVLPRTRQRRDLVELSAFLARLAGDGLRSEEHTFELQSLMRI